MLLGFIGTNELIIIGVLALIIFGPSKLPQLGSSIGKMLRGFKDEIKEMESEKNEAEQASAAEREIDVTPVEPASGDKAS